MPAYTKSPSTTGFWWGVIIIGSRHRGHAASMSTFAKKSRGGKVGVSCISDGLESLRSVSEGFSMGSARKTKYLGNDGGARRVSGVIRSIASSRGISPRMERFGLKMGKICLKHERGRRRERRTGCRQPTAQRDATKCRGTMEGGVESRENKRLGEYAHPILRYPQIGPNYPTIHRNACNSAKTAAAVTRKAPLERTRYRVGNFEGEGERVVPSNTEPRAMGSRGIVDDEMVTIGEDKLGSCRKGLQLQGISLSWVCLGNTQIILTGSEEVGPLSIPNPGRCAWVQVDLWVVPWVPGPTHGLYGL
ncbi:hypothetical protein EDC04DRAFT_3087974 [Pisolithus marmoratus]|nr:hypothetical protein EDC04DRAFT_3087974 [Pisolithus marmoratus]